jgi:VIT1/CCC1 family predicted Fe2+/Mn2+ transporter
MEDALDRWRSEKTASYLSLAVAAAEPDAGRAALFRQMAPAADEQAGILAKELPATRAFAPSLRARIIVALVGAFGPRAMVPILSATKVRGVSVYRGKAAPIGHPWPTSVEDIGKQHRNFGGGMLRAGVFGANDGLVSNTCLLKRYPEEELALIYAARGIPKKEARKLAKMLIANPEQALDTLAREELGLNPDDLGSPIGAAVSSFIAFAIGASLLLIPFLLGFGGNKLVIAAGVSGIALFVVGAILSLFSGKSAVVGGLRVLLIGAAAAAATYFIGSLFNVATT